jgi:hypothetical protein
MSFAFAGCQGGTGDGSQRPDAGDGTAADASSTAPDAIGNVSDAAGLICNNDSEIEPNESIANPTNVIVPGGQGGFTLVSLAICPANDQDVFQFTVGLNGTDVVVEMNYSASVGTLGLQLLQSDGSVLSTGAPVSGNDDVVRVAIPNIPADTYYVRVFSAGNVQNNYSIKIETFP